MPRTSPPAPQPTSAAPGLDRAATLLRDTRLLSTAAASFLAVQLFGNLYEEVVTNAANIADPRVAGLGGELSPGSPLYYYLPWAPLGVVLVAILTVRLGRLAAPSWIVRRLAGALAALAVAVVSKVLLITRINPLFRDPTIAVESLREAAITWAFVNGVAILAVTTALALLLSWRGRVLDIAAPGPTGAHTGPGLEGDVR